MIEAIPRKTLKSAFALLCSAVMLLATVYRAPTASAQDSGERTGITDNEILLGSCCSLTGALAERGHSLMLGSNAYFSYVNEKGINGRKLKMKFCDDKYDGEQAITSFNTCLKDKAFAGAFFVGSAPIAKYVRMGEASKMPMMGFCSGTPILYDFHPTEFVVRPGYVQEVEKQVDMLWEMGIHKIAIIYQNDAFGAAIRLSTIKCLAKCQAAPVLEASYSRNSVEIDDAFRRVSEAKPEAVILGATAGALTAIIKKRNEAKWKPLMLAVSVASDYVGEMGQPANGVIVTQVMPLLDAKLPAVDLYNKYHKKYNPPGTPTSHTAFEAFINGIVIAEAFKRCGRDVTRDKFIKAMESIRDFDLGLGSNFKVSYSSRNHIGFTSKAIYFTIIQDGKLVPLSTEDIRAITKTNKQ
jgi:branched-chain amino acid transport system substrate-binding protein